MFFKQRIEKNAADEKDKKSDDEEEDEKNAQSATTTTTALEHLKFKVNENLSYMNHISDTFPRPNGLVTLTLTETKTTTTTTT